jgi:hypothetical protein
VRSACIAYHTTDEVNLQSATRAARACGATLSRLAGPTAPPSGTFAAVLHDLDHLDFPDGQVVVSELLDRPALFPVAVHGYSLNDEEVTGLRSNGVLVARKLSSRLVHALCRAADRSPTAVSEPPERDAGEATADPAVLCEMVRSLATQAHRAMRGSQHAANGIADDLGGLMERIGQVRQLVDQFRSQDCLAFDDLQRWLDSLLRCIEGFLAQPHGEVEK